MSEKLDNEEIITKLKRQNKVVQETELRVVSTFGKNSFKPVIEIDSDGFDKVMMNEHRKLNIGWSSCERMHQRTQVL